MGSLYTSIIPSLVLDGVGKAIRESKCQKILLLNSCPDRETSGLSAVDYVVAITKALIKNDEGGLINLEGFKYDTSKGIGYSTSSSGDLQALGYAPTRDYLLRVAARHYVNTVIFVDDSSVRGLMMSDSVLEQLSSVGITSVPVKGIPPAAAPTAVSTDGISNFRNSFRHSWEFPALPPENTPKGGASCKTPAVPSRISSAPIETHYSSGPTSVVKPSVPMIFDSEHLVMALKTLLESRVEII
jgi:2-phospho-L-lactate transferase CofD